MSVETTVKDGFQLNDDFGPIRVIQMCVPSLGLMAATVIAGGMILLLVYFVWLAAQKRKNWPRWVLAAALVLSVVSLAQIIGERGVELDSGIEIISCVLTAIGLYFSFTGDAQGWFNA